MPKITIIEGERVVPQKKKVAAYARVSKDTEQLMHSLSAQVSYYSDLIQRNPQWEYAGVYVDAGITGTSTTARPQFQRMIKDCEAGKIHVILTKSISRFARNTVDLLSTVRHLKELGIEVRFEKEHIHSLTADGEVMLTILASFAEQESVSVSKNIKWSFQKKFRKGQVHSHQKMLGYRWEGDRRVVVPEEAEIVRFIFTEYINGQSCAQIAKTLHAKGIKSVRGRKFPVESIIRILANIQYTGCLVMQQHYNYAPKKEKLNYGEMPMYCIDDHHEAIISPETFAAAQAMKEKRGNARREAMQIARAKTEPSIFSGKVRCGKCGSRAHWHRYQSGRLYWICSKHNEGKKKCDCKTLQDRILVQAAMKVLGTEDVNPQLERIKTVHLFDEKLVFELRNGRKKTWHRE